MSDDIFLRKMKAGEEKSVCDLVVRSFDEFVAPEYSPEGVERFINGATPERISELLQEGSLILVAEAESEIVGVIIMVFRNNKHHIRWLFVDGKYHRRGIARSLFNKALEILRSCNQEIREVTVNSSPYAVRAYERMGFRKMGAERSEAGMLVIPMIMELPENGR